MYNLQKTRRDQELAHAFRRLLAAIDPLFRDDRCEAEQVTVAWVLHRERLARLPFNPVPQRTGEPIKAKRDIDIGRHRCICRFGVCLGIGVRRVFDRLQPPACWDAIIRDIDKKARLEIASPDLTVCRTSQIHGADKDRLFARVLPEPVELSMNESRHCLLRLATCPGPCQCWWKCRPRGVRPHGLIEFGRHLGRAIEVTR